MAIDYTTKESQEVLSQVASELTKLFPKTDNEPTYSIGFQRFSKMGSKRKLALVAKYNFDSSLVIELLQIKTVKELEQYSQDTINTIINFNKG